MLTFLIAFLMSAVVSVVLTPLVRDVALRYGWVDAPTEARKVHVRPVPRVGGVAIFLGFMTPVFALLLWDNRVSSAVVSDTNKFLGLVVGGAVAAGVGLYDDIYGIRPVPKLLAQSVAAGVAIFAGYQISMIANPFGAPIAFGLMTPLVTWLWIVGLMNAINLIDGLDGLAAGISLIAVCTLFALGVVGDNPVVGLTTAALAGALLGFLRHNFNPASVFMGDSGSLFLGFVLAVSSISGSAKSSTLVALLIPVVALGLPLMDTSLTLVRRFIAGTPLFGADRSHIHHRLLDLGFTHRQTVLVLYASALGLACAALLLIFANNAQSAVILGATMLGMVAFGRVLGYLRLDSLSSAWRYGRQRSTNLASILDTAADVAARVRAAESLEALSATLHEALPELAADGGELVLQVGEAGVGYEVRFIWPSETLPQDVVSECFSLDDDARASVGCLELVWRCDEGELRLPERPVYEWLAWQIRERALTLTALTTTEASSGDAAGAPRPAEAGPPMSAP